MHCLERLPALTARSILRFIQSIQSDKVAKGKGWFTRYSDEIKEMNTSHAKLIKKDTPRTLKLQTDWDQLHTRIFQAEMGICHKFQLMQTLLSNKDSQDKSLELERLRNGILDTNSGVLNNLSVINQVLIGQTITNPTEKGLLEIWSNGMFDNMRTNPMSAKTYQNYVDQYLEKAAILQFRGVLLYTEANSNYQYCSYQYELFENNLKSQIEAMEQTVPPFMKYLTDPDEKKVFVLRPDFDGKTVPFVRSKGLNKKLDYDFMCGYPDEGKWIFKKSPQFDENGSLLISGHSNDGKCNYISISEKNIATCVSEECRATPFYVIPLNVTEKRIQIIFRRSEPKPEDKPFLGNSLKCVDDNDDIEFILTFDCK